MQKQAHGYTTAYKRTRSANYAKAEKLKVIQASHLGFRINPDPDVD